MVGCLEPKSACDADMECNICGALQPADVDLEHRAQRFSAPATALELLVAGPAGHICTIQARSTSTVQELKALIETSAGIPVAGQRLFHDTKELLVGEGVLGEQLPAGTQEEQLLLVRRDAKQGMWLDELQQMFPVRKRSGQQTVSNVAVWLEHAPDEAKRDREVVLAAVAKDGLALRHAHPSLQADRDVVLVAIAENGCALQYACACLKEDLDVVLAAVARHWWAFKFVCADLRDNRDVVLAVVALAGQALVYTSPALRADRDVVLVAVAQAGHALAYASAELKGEHDVVMAAVRRDGMALEYASSSLRSRWKRASVALGPLQKRGMGAAVVLT